MLVPAVLFGLILAFILALLLFPAYGEHDYFSANVKWSGSPSVCIVDIPKEDKFITLRAVKSWENAMVDYIGPIDFYSIKYLNSGDLAICNILVYQAKYFDPNPITGVKPIGNTECIKSEAKCIIKVNREYREGVKYYDTLVHEMGHALGLKHRLSYNMTGVPAVFMSNDIMMPVAKDNLHITKESLDALIFFYEDGNFHLNYTIPHGNEWK